ncbi:MAG: beta-ketoacyl synthase N-terminal-like domain-containing protein [Gammaproteobacteria bacterium]|jgi:3-oxoacyl-[acyl-carrier-protein] synthase II
MKLPAHALAITGMGLHTSLGCGLDENWHKLINGHSGVREIMRFSTAHLPTKIAATVDLNLNGISRVSTLAENVVQQILCMSPISKNLCAESQIVIATTPAMEMLWQDRFTLSQHKNCEDPESIYSYITCGHPFYFLQERYGFSKMPYFVNTACASGAHAIQLAAEQIHMGHTKIAMAIGLDACVEAETIARFSLLSTLSTANDNPAAASKPFSLNRDGFVLGEGAGALMLEDVEYAKARGANILAYLIGYADVTDNFHRTRSNPSGEKIIACMQKALDDAQITTTQVDYINAHGTSTPENDKMEGKSIQLLFGDHCQKLLISSNKSMIGHTLSAAGTIEAVFSILTLQHQLVPPTINYTQPDPDILLNVVPNKAISTPVNIVLSNSFGFGGQNVSLIFAKDEISWKQ